MHGQNNFILAMLNDKNDINEAILTELLVIWHINHHINNYVSLVTRLLDLR